MREDERKKMMMWRKVGVNAACVCVCVCVFFFFFLNIFKNFYGKRKNKAKMQNPLSKFHKNSFQSSNFAFVHSSSLCFKFIHHRTPLVRWSLHKYKYLWGVGGKGQGSSF